MTDRVRAIIETDLTNDQINPYLAAAEVMLLNAFRDKVIDTVTREELKVWLTAHYIAVTRQRVSTKEAAGGASIEYAGVYGAALESTPWGQTAMALDTTGSLKAASGKKGNIQLIAIQS